MKTEEIEAIRVALLTETTHKDFEANSMKAMQILNKYEAVNNGVLDGVMNKLCDCLMPSLDNQIIDRCSRCNGSLISHLEQSELLKKWWKWFDEECVSVNCNDEERQEVISRFFYCL